MRSGERLPQAPIIMLVAVVALGIPDADAVSLHGYNIQRTTVHACVSSVSSCFTGPRGSERERDRER